MQVPRSAATFNSYIGIVTAAIRQAMGSAGLVAALMSDDRVPVDAAPFSATRF